MKYVVPAIFFLPCNEILSLIGLLVLSIMFIGDIIAAREETKTWR